MPIGADGKHIPWLTYPAIEFLDGLDFTGKSIFEFGGGGSTLYWARRARNVTTVELDPSWAEHLQRIAPPNVAVLHETNGHSYAETPKKLARNFDVIVVDGAERYRSTQAALSSIKAGGMIILDNAEWYPNSAALIAAAGFIEIPFNGLSPINSFSSTSSVFLSRDFDFHRSNRSDPIGGRQLTSGALDDAPPNLDETIPAHSTIDVGRITE